MGGGPNPLVEVQRIAYKALSQPWPSDIDGARACRVLVGLLTKARQLNALWIVSDRDKLAEEIGLAEGMTVKNALIDLQSLGYLNFEPGIPDQYEKGRATRVKQGKPTEIWLLPQSDVSGELTLRILPEMTLDIFSSAQLGSAGWFATARLQYEWEHQEGLSDSIAVSVADLMKMTGMKRTRVKELLPKLCSALSAGFVPREGSKYVFHRLDDINRSRFADTRAAAGLDRAFQRRIAQQSTTTSSAKPGA